MNRPGNRTVGLLLTAVMLLGFLMPVGCSKNNSSKQIRETAEQFIKSFGEGDADSAEALVNGNFECAFKSGPTAEIMLKMASRTEITEWKDIEIDDEEQTAKTRVKISYVKATKIIYDYGNYGMNKDQYFDTIENAKLNTTTLKLGFVFDKDEGKWLIDEKSAGEYKELFDYASQVKLIMMTEAEAQNIFEEAFYRFAEGDFDNPKYPLDTSGIRCFDYDQDDDEIVNEGAREFAKAYFKYIADHGISLETDIDNPYCAVLTGFAPSKSEILEYVSSDECVESDYIVRMRLVSAARRDVQPDILRSAIDAELYKKLAGKIPEMSPEEYSVTLRIVVGYDSKTGSPVDFLFLGDDYSDEMIIPIGRQEGFNATERSPEQEFRCRRKACEDLLASGEIPQEKYDIYMLAIERDEYVYSGGTVPEYEFIRYVEWEGTGDCINQAVDVVEVLPDYSDGQLLYGESEFDSNGYYIFYSREPGWLNTAGYYIDNDKVVVMLKFDNKFAKGTTLVYDWYIDDEEEGDSVFFTIEEDDTDELVFEIPNMQISRYSKYEFRLWEEDHMHVIAYVSLSQT